MKIKVVFFWFCALAGLKAHAQAFQSMGMPPLEIFAPSDYNQKGKVWEITSAPNGLLYFAADKGLLEYDGSKWNTFTGSIGFTRSVLVANDSLIFTGSDLDFGIWKRNRLNQFNYTSLYPFQNENKAINEEFWDIHQIDDKVLFVSSHNIYISKNQQITKIPAPSRFLGSYKVGENVYFADDKGLMVLKNMSLSKIIEFPKELKIELAGIYNQESELILVSKNSGLYKFSDGNLTRIQNSLSDFLSQAKVFCFTQTQKQQLVFGTVLKGLIITDENGKVIHQINKKKGLPNNTILSVHSDVLGKLWVGMDLGISSIDLYSPFSYVYDHTGDFGSGYTAAIYTDNFYLGTNQGLYSAPWNSINNKEEFFRFSLVPSSEGQVWNLKEIDNSLLVCHDKGLFSLVNNQLIRISSLPGFWTIEKLAENIYLSGNYSGVFVFRKKGETLELIKQMDDIFGSCNQITVESEKSIWINIPNFGVLHAELNQNYKPLKRTIFESHEFSGAVMSIEKANQDIYVITKTKKYVYNPKLQKFEFKEELRPQSSISNTIDGFEAPIRLSADYKFYSIYNGFALKSSTETENFRNIQPILLLRKIQVFSNDFREQISSGTQVPYSLNNIQLEFSSPLFKDVLFQYKIGSKSNWSEPSESNTIDVLDLKQGTHRIFARLNLNGVFSKEVECVITIQSPWYASAYAIVVYIILFIALLAVHYRWQKFLLKKQKLKLMQREELALKTQADKHQLEILAIEQQMLQNEFDQLKNQLKSKTVELASKAKDNEEKKQLLLLLKEKFEALQNDTPNLKLRMNEIKRLLEINLNAEDHTFEIQIDELHQEFFRKLKEKFPALSMHELRLCAYLKIGLNSKEIAEIMNILPSSVFVSRSRLRKKLNLSADDDMVSFFNSL